MTNTPTVLSGIQEQTIDMLIKCHNEQYEPYSHLDNSLEYLRMLMDDEETISPKPVVVVVEVEFPDRSIGPPLEMISMLIEKPWTGKTTMLRKPHESITNSVTIGVQFCSTDDYFNFTMTKYNTLIRNVYEPNTNR